MGFTKINKGKWGAARGKSNTVRVASYPPSKFHVMFGREVYEQLGSPKYAEIQIGSGEDAGWLKITPTATATGYCFVRSGQGKSTLKLQFGSAHVDAKGLRIPTTEVRFLYFADGSLLVNYEPAIRKSRNAAQFQRAPKGNAAAAERFATA